MRTDKENARLWRRLVLACCLLVQLTVGAAPIAATPEQIAFTSFRLLIYTSDPTSECSVSAEGSYEDYLPCLWQYARWIATKRYGNRVQVLDDVPYPSVEMSIGNVICGDAVALGCCSMTRDSKETVLRRIRVANTGDLVEWNRTVVHEYLHYITSTLDVDYDSEARWLDSLPNVCEAAERGQIKPYTRENR